VKRLQQNEQLIPPGLVDLAAERLGGQAMLASDEFFAEKENLLKPGRGIFIPDKYTDRGKWMDGWESRRKRTPGHDWCIIKLGLPGMIKVVDIDTNHFLGNHPPFASLDAAAVEQSMTIEKLSSDLSAWAAVIPKSPLNPGAHNIFTIADDKRWTHVRLNIYPDGGVARLRVYGEVVPDWSKYGSTDLVDLASVGNGGAVVTASDMYFGSSQNLLMPGRAASMADGWETRRRRGPGNDWAIIKLGRAGRVQKIEIDTTHFKGNYPDECSLESCNSPAGSNRDSLTSSSVEWQVLLPRIKLKPDATHCFERELQNPGACTHVRLSIYPDGGVSRLRVWGVVGNK
jgi:allantoicase